LREGGAGGGARASIGALRVRSLSDDGTEEAGVLMRFFGGVVMDILLMHLV